MGAKVTRDRARLKPSVFSAFLISAVIASSSAALAQLTIEPQSFKWATEVTISVAPGTQGSRFSLVISKNDILYATVSTAHQGVWKSSVTKMEWDGVKFAARMVIPSGCEYGSIGVISNENSYITSKAFLPLGDDGLHPPGALIMGMLHGTHDRQNWQSDIRSDVARMTDRGWAYQEIWGLRYMAMRNISAEELQKEIQSVEREEKSPSLLRSLAYGYFLIGDLKSGLAKLADLCRTYPESPYAVMALDNAIYANVTHGWQEQDAEIEKLRAQVANAAPGNPGLWRNEANSVFYLTQNSAIRFENLKIICTLWVKERPENAGPYLVLARRMADMEPVPADAEHLATKAIEFSYGPMRSAASNWERALAYRTRSQIRIGKKDWAGAVADIKAAQVFAPQGRTEDMELEAELWIKLGYPHRAEAVALDAYRKGSLAAETLVKKLYVGRTGREEGFKDYFMDRLSLNAQEAFASGEPRGIAAPELPPAPAFKATTLEGSEVDSEKLKGSVIALNFWFIGCGPCLGEMPELNKIAEQFKGRVRFLAVASDSADDLRRFADNKTFKYEIIPGGGWAVKPGSYPVEGYPTHYVIDRDGRIAWKATGASPANIERLRAVLQRLLEQQR